MAINRQDSLFESSESSSMGSSVDWVSGILMGELAVGLCVIAVTVIGFVVLSGRIPFRAGGRVVLGVFVLLSAPTIAAGFGAVLEDPTGPAPMPYVAEFDIPPRERLPPAHYDPYAGASLRRD